MALEDTKVDSNLKTLSGMRASISVNAPNPVIDSVQGTFRRDGDPRGVGFNISNVVLRSSKIKNIDYCFVSVLATGRDTKVMLNSNSSWMNVPPRRSRLEQSFPYYLIFGVAPILLSLFGTSLLLFIYLIELPDDKRLNGTYDPNSKKPYLFEHVYDGDFTEKLMTSFF